LGPPMNRSRSPEEYNALARQSSTADIEAVCGPLRDKTLTVLRGAESASDGAKSVDVQAGAYTGSRFDCLVVISFSQFGNLCMVSYTAGPAAFPRGVDLDGILARAGWLQVPDDDITTVLDESTD